MILNSNKKVANISINNKKIKLISKDGNIIFQKNKNNFLKLLLSNITINNCLPDFSKSPTTDIGLFKMEDNDGISYYFRGIKKYFKFAGFYWQVIRINGDGAIRLFYCGKTVSDATASIYNRNIGTGNFQSNDSHNYIMAGFKYTSGELHGTSVKSNVLTKLETWFENNLMNYTEYIDSNSYFINDRGIYSGTGTSKNTIYVGYDRLVTNKLPSLKCDEILDIFTCKNADKGNKALDYPIGLITADEAALFGGIYTGSSISPTIQTMTPTEIDTYGSVKLFNYNDTTSGITSYHARFDHDNFLVPIINLRSDLKFEGSGSLNDPYRIVGVD